MSTQDTLLGVALIVGGFAILGVLAYGLWWAGREGGER